MASKKPITESKVKKSLIKQLTSLGKTSDHFLSLVDDYMYLWRLKKKLQDDIDKEGLRKKVKNGNGFDVEKPNESIPLLHKTQAQMLSILKDLGLEEPAIEDDDLDDY